MPALLWQGLWAELLATSISSSSLGAQEAAVGAPRAKRSALAGMGGGGGAGLGSGGLCCSWPLPPTGVSRGLAGEQLPSACARRAAGTKASLGEDVTQRV